MRQHRPLAVQSATRSCFLTWAVSLLPPTPLSNFSLLAKHPGQRIPIVESCISKAALEVRAENLRLAGYIVTILSPMIQ
jgi:hypothetical protein